MSNIPKLINTVQDLGYKVSLEGDKIKLKFTGKGDPPKETLTTINQVKGNKAIVIEYLKTISRMDTVFMDAAHEISKVYQSPAISYTAKVFPVMYEKAVTLENKINLLWDEGKDPKGFIEAVQAWQDLHMKFIKLLNTKKRVEAVHDRVYNSPNRKPDPSQGLGKERKENGTV